MYKSSIQTRYDIKLHKRCDESPLYSRSKPKQTMEAEINQLTINFIKTMIDNIQ